MEKNKVQPAQQPWSQQLQKKPQPSKTATPSSAKVSEKVFEDIFSKPQLVSDEKTGIDVLLFGDTDVGKTYCSMTFPEPIFIIDTEKRAEKTKKYYYPNKDIRVYYPLVIREDFKSSTKGDWYIQEEDHIDFKTSIDNITNTICALNKRIVDGEITQGTLVVDSLSDIWDWVTQWGKERIARKLTKKGEPKIDKDTLNVVNQMDWGLMNGKNARLMTLFKHVMNGGLSFVGTAREKFTPDYVADKPISLSGRIRCQKYVPFDFKSIINLKVQRVKSPTGFSVKYLADIIRLDTIDCNKTPIENIDYEKIKELIGKLPEEIKKK